MTPRRIRNGRATFGKGMAMARKLLLVAALLLTGSAVASDRPHYPEPAVPVPLFPANTCAQCHIPHGATGATLTVNSSNANLCTSCHTAKAPGPGIGTWQPTDQAVPGTSGSSHNYTAAGAGTTNPRVATYNVTAPPGASPVKLAPGNLLQCSACHDQHSQLSAPADPNAPPYPADATVTEARRHFQVMTNSTAEMCFECHTAWKQSTVTSATYAAGANRSHPVVNKDNLATPTKLTMNAAGTGAADKTYKQVPHDMPMRVTLTTSTTTTLNFNANAPRLATNALNGWAVRFLGGTQKNVVTQITANSATSATVTALAAAPAAGTVVEIDRVSYGYYAADWDVATSNTATAITDTTKTWVTTGNSSPFGGAGSVTILASGPTGTADVGKTCAIGSNNANTLTLTGCTLTAQGGTLPNAVVYRINWRLAGSGTTTAAGTATTFIDNTKTLWASNGPVGLQVRFLASNKTARITGWNNTTWTATISPALTVADTAAGLAYQLEPAQVGPYAGAVAASPAPTTTGFTASTNAFGAANAVANYLLRFTSGTQKGVVTRVVTNAAANAVTYTAIPGAPAANDTFEIDLDGNATNNVWLGGAAPTFSNPATGQVTCMSCHGLHYADSDAGTYDDVGRTGDGHLLRRGWSNGTSDEVCEACHATRIHNSLSVGSKYGAWGTAMTCTTCHQPHLTGNVLLVKPTITRPDGTATVNIDFRDAVNGQGPNAMVNGPLSQPTAPFYTSGNGPCEACHTQTRNGALYVPGTAPLGTGSVTVNGTTVTCSGACNFNALVTAAGWEFKIAADPATSWTRVNSATATTMALAVAYPRTVTTAAAYEIANPRFRTASAQRVSGGTGATAGSGRGVAAADHPTAACTNCHSHATGFKASCTSCHGTEGRTTYASEAPPKDSLGNTTATGGTAPNRVGAHAAHLGQKGTGALSNGVACSDCHANPPVRADHPPATSPNPLRRAQLTWGALTLRAVDPWSGAPIPAGNVIFNTSTQGCSATYCHGNFTNGNNATPTWGGTAACGSCHGTSATNPTPTGTHDVLANGANCIDCHPGYNFIVGTGPQGTTNGVDPILHINGKLDGGGDCVSCHTGPKGALPRRAIAPEFTTAGNWSHKRSATPSGSVTKFDCIVCHMEGDMTTGDRVSGVHGNGVINLRDPDTGLHIKGVTFTAASGTNPGSYVATTSDMSFSRFSRNLNVALENDPNFLLLGAIMINQCLKCHDANGANSCNTAPANQKACVPGTGSAVKPFGTTIAGAGYTGTGVTAGGVTGAVTDINAAFDTNNSSYHPIRGKQNNWYAKLTRMVVPWDATRTGTAANTTSWGYLLSCWDCHAPQGTASTATLTSTVTAHGGATTVRGTSQYPNPTAPASTTNEATLCSLCHAGYRTAASSHGTGSAFTSGNNGMTAYVQFGCNTCHSAGWPTLPARPVKAQDVHGVNALPSGGLTKTGRWNNQSLGTPAQQNNRPYAFIRNTQQLTDHTPRQIGGTTYTGSTDTVNAFNCNMAGTGISVRDCNQGIKSYGTGGTY